MTYAVYLPMDQEKIYMRACAFRKYKSAKRRKEREKQREYNVGYGQICVGNTQVLFVLFLLLQLFCRFEIISK